MSNPLFPDFFMQCCDAINYIDLGNACALENNCYGDLRPGGAYYWFSWPTRLGLPNDALVYANFLLLLLSVFFATLAMLSVSGQVKAIHLESSKLKGFMLVAINSIIILIIHLIFFWPTIFTSLSDPPSTLFFLNGCWLLLLSCQTTAIKKTGLLIAAGLLLGGSAWVRAFYLYPVLAGVFFCCLMALITPRRNFVYAVIIAAFIPIVFQLANTYSRHGKWSYFNSEESDSVANMHLTSTSIGYDTLLPGSSHFSPPQHCEIRSGMLASLQARDYSSLFCLFTNRAVFYLGSYRSVTYIYYRIKNQLFSLTTESVGDEKLWHSSNLDVHANVAPDPQGGMTADKMTVSPLQQYVGTYISPWTAFPSNTDYTFSLWLSSDTPKNIQLAIARHSDGLVIASTMAAVTKQPQQFFVSARNANIDKYRVSVGPTLSDTNVPDNGSSSDTFYFGGVQLEKGAGVTEYHGGTYLVHSAMLLGNSDYTFSVWLWSDMPMDIQLSFTSIRDESVIATTMVTLTREPQRFSISGRTLTSGRYSLVIGSGHSDTNVRFGATPFDSFYLWGSQLEEGATMKEYVGFEPVVSSSIREWNVWILLTNGIALILASLCIIRFRQIWLYEPAGLTVMIMACAVFAEALAIIPEQRFCVAFMVLIWVLATSFVLSAPAKPAVQCTVVNP